MEYRKMVFGGESPAGQKNTTELGLLKTDNNIECAVDVYFLLLSFPTICSHFFG